MDTNAPDDRAILTRAVEIATPIIEFDETRLISDQEVIASDETDRILAHGLWAALERLVAGRDKHQVCGWCVRAAGDTPEAWQEAARMTLDKTEPAAVDAIVATIVAQLRNWRPVALLAGGAL